MYISADHRADPASGCVMPTLSADVARSSPQIRAAYKRKMVALIYRMSNVIEANLDGHLTVDHLASIACLSRFHFARAFKAAIGQSPHRYVSGKRLERAEALLVRGDQSLVDIALALNFSCQANFTRAFRQATGQTPGQYRRNFSV
jgi:AraC family transcriptional regulator